MQNKIDRFGKDLLHTDKKSNLLFRLLFKLIISIIIGFLLSYTVSNCLLYPLRLKVNYMEPGYKKGSILYVKPVYGKKEYKRNSVVLFINPYNQKKTIGRVIAINGDKISIHKKKVYLNDSVLEEKYTQFTDSRGFIPSEYSKRDFMDPKIIKSGYYFILTDNRDESPDSRDFGSIEGKHIIGKVLF